MNKITVCFAIAAIGIIAIFIFDRQAPKETTMTMQRKMETIPGNLDYSRTLTSVGKKYIISISSRLDPIPINKIHKWEIRVKTPQGVPVDGATVSIMGGMPMHKHGMPTAPRVTKDLRQGDYLLEGMKFSMAGWWELIVQVKKGSDRDKATFNVILR